MKSIVLSFIVFIFSIYSHAQEKGAANISTQSSRKIITDTILLRSTKPGVNDRYMVITTISSDRVRTKEEQNNFIYIYNGQTISKEEGNSLMKSWDVVKLEIDETKDIIEHRISKGDISGIKK